MLEAEAVVLLVTRELLELELLVAVAVMICTQRPDE
jgi:hypothetical protein